MCCHAVDDGVAAGWRHKLHAVAAGVVQAARPVVDLHAGDDCVVGLAGVNALADQLLQVGCDGALSNLGDVYQVERVVNLLVVLGKDVVV